ncbi:hypothetical protein ACQR1I_35495 [Bradyrhizobium sp. HKCCYLS2038]|uniref:hypothetical protein n=1 Tax=unclassified Bradyrhizobium TaxID=2631580 RepID=UPI003EC00971
MSETLQFIRKHAARAFGRRGWRRKFEHVALIQDGDIERHVREADASEVTFMEQDIVREARNRRGRAITALRVAQDALLRAERDLAELEAAVEQRLEQRDEAKVFYDLIDVGTVGMMPADRAAILAHFKPEYM